MQSVFTSPPLLAAYVAWPLLLLAGFFGHPPGENRASKYFLSVTATFAAAGLGTVAGAFASPSESTEGAMFKVIAGTISAVVSTFVVKEYRDQIKSFPRWIGDDANAARFWMFVSGLLIAAIVTFVYRVYFFETRSQAAIARELSEDLVKLQANIQSIAHPASGAANGTCP